jgi:hypothetical protein
VKHQPTLEILFEQATTCRNLAEEAYEQALRNRQKAGDADAAGRVLLAANLVRSNLYAAMLNGLG